MCGIVGLYLKEDGLRSRLGELFVPMLVEMTDRGPDSAGIAVYRDNGEDGVTKFTVYHPDETFDWTALSGAIQEGTDNDVFMTTRSTHSTLTVAGPVKRVEEIIAAFDPELQIMSAGRTVEIFKETGLPEEVAARFDLEGQTGSHAVGHTRMATESAVTTAGSHPFSTGLDLCLVHNGSLSNHNQVRERLRRHKGMTFRTENDTEVAAAYISSRLADGRSLHQALEDSLDDLDGFYTFVAGTREGFAVLRDPIACKPAVLAETDDYVAFASEYRALVGLPDIEKAKVWEPEPAVVYSWGGHA